MNLRHLALTTVLVVADFTTASAQTPARAPADSSRPAAEAGETWRISPLVVFASGFDSNVNRDAEDLDAIGVAVGAGFDLVNNVRKPTLALAYQAGFHRYTATSRWNRVSHFARAEWTRSLSRDWSLDVTTEMALKGSAEDRELGDQYLLSPQIEFKIDSRLRLRGIGTFRLRRYDADPGRDATNRYFGVELVGRPGRGPRWDLGLRVEDNATRDPRRAYDRYTAYGEWTHPVTRRDRLDAELKVRLQRYPNRLVDVAGGPDVPREDVRWEPSVSWLHQVPRGEVAVTYAYEQRTSNDRDRGYGAHTITMSITARR